MARLVRYDIGQLARRDVLQQVSHDIGRLALGKATSQPPQTSIVTEDGFPVTEESIPVTESG